jgi:hypothetical protein
MMQQVGLTILAKSLRGTLFCRSADGAQRRPFFWGREEDWRLGSRSTFEYE